MNKKLTFIILCLVVIAFASPALVLADATETDTRQAKRGGGSQGINYMVTPADASKGYTQHIDSAGAASVMEYPKTIVASTGSTLNAGVALVSSACRVSTITISGTATSAGAWVKIYDAASATGTPKIEISLGTAKDTRTITIPGGATFSTGVFADSSENLVHLSVTYDN